MTRTLGKIGITAAAAGISVAYFLIPAWYRVPPSLTLSPLYAGRFLILFPMLLALAAWGVAGFSGLRTVRRTHRAALWATLLLAFALWSFFSQTWAFMGRSRPDVAETAALQLGAAALFALITACGLVPVRRLAIVLVVGLLLNSVLVIGQSIVQHDLGLRALGEFRFSPSTEGVSILAAGALRYVRPYGLLPHPNILAGSLIPGVFAAVALALGDPRAAVRALATLATVLGTAALLLTFSRSAWVGAAAGGVAFVVLNYPSLRAAIGSLRMRTSGTAFPESTFPDVPPRRLLSRVLLLGMLLTLVGGVFAVRYWPYVTARAGIGEESVELRSIADRLVFTDFALRSIAERPAVGVGIGNFPWRSSYYLQTEFYDLQGDYVHHIYLAVTADLGIVGLLLYVGAMLAGAAAAVGAIRNAAGGERLIRAGMLSAAAAFAVVGLFDHYPYTILHIQVALWGCFAAALQPGPPLRGPGKPL
ncbi:MAG: O-antigen ligase family protein [Chloroflexi bacterium]|nr:O-antigen ligase family protein [Chloroflexota bacterium]